MLVMSLENMLVMSLESYKDIENMWYYWKAIEVLMISCDDTREI
jgi:hypothetical protein